MSGPAATVRRRRVSSLLQSRAARERLVLALLLVERLTPVETARALGIPRSRVTRIYASLLARLRGAFDAASSRLSRRRTAPDRSPGATSARPRQKRRRSRAPVRGAVRRRLRAA